MGSKEQTLERLSDLPAERLPPPPPLIMHSSLFQVPHHHSHP